MNKPAAETFQLKRLDAARMQAAIPALANVLHSCVMAGASVNFLHPFSLSESTAFWREKVHPRLVSQNHILIVAEKGGRIVGTVQLDCDTPPNQPHRGEVTKLLVHPDLRRQGVGRALMHCLETEALAAGRWLLTLDTRSGDHSEKLYSSMGYIEVGRIPDYCIDPANGQLDATTLMYKKLK